MSLPSRPRLQLIKIYQWRDKVPNKKNNNSNKKKAFAKCLKIVPPALV